MPSTYSILRVMETLISVLLILHLATFRIRTRRCGHRNGVCNSLCAIRSELLPEFLGAASARTTGNNGLSHLLIAQNINADRAFREYRLNFKAPSHCLDVAPERAQIHVSTLFYLRNRAL